MKSGAINVICWWSKAIRFFKSDKIV